MVTTHMSYKNYLEFVEKKVNFRPHHKIMAGLAIFIFVAVSTFSAMFYQYKTEEPQRIKYQYLESVNVDFDSASQSLDELLTTFQVAGEKIQIVDNPQKDNDSTAAFFVTLDDLEKNISRIESTKQSLDTKNTTLIKMVTPNELVTVHDQLMDFYQQSSNTLSEIEKDHLFAKELLLSSGPKFYLSTLTDDSLWEKAKKDDIVNYYQTTKAEADTALTNLAKLSVPTHFEQYYKAQIAYLTLLVGLSDNIINTLSVENSTNVDEATQMEKAYQLLVAAKKENEQISKKLLEEKLKIVDVGPALSKLAQAQIQRNSVREGLSLSFSQTPKFGPGNPYLEGIFDKIGSYF